MKFYWTLNSIPELQGLPKARQRQLWQIGFRKSWHLPRVWASYLFMVITFAISILVLIPLRLDAFPHNTFIIMGWCLFWSGLGVFTANQFCFAAVRPVLATIRAEMDSKDEGDGSYYVPPAF